MLHCFGADSLVIGRLLALEGRHRVALLASFSADSLVAGRLSEVEGRHGVTTSAGFLEASLVTGRRSLVEGRCDAAEEGLLKPVVPLKLLVASLDLCSEWIFSGFAIWFITLGLPGPSP
jgi:hypothetical protein